MILGVSTSLDVGGLGMENYGPEELKLIYRVLHRQLTQYPELIDSSFFEDLQRHLQKQAILDGIDIGEHGAWDAWLGNELMSCSVRMQHRAVIG
jgi:hypothetical protein